MAEIKEVGSVSALETDLGCATHFLELLAKTNPQELREHRGQIAHLFSLARKVWNDAYAPALATRFDSDD